MDAQQIVSERIFTKTVNIYAQAFVVWRAITDIDLMKQWMLEEEIDIITDWQIGSPILINGNAHWVYFENKGTVSKYEPDKLLQYSHLSSLSKLADLAENYSLISFKLVPEENQTVLTLTITDFPTESIYKHMAFYWNTTLDILKKFVESYAPGI